MQASAVREAAQAAGIEVLTPTSLRNDAFSAHLRHLAPQTCPIVAYGGLVPASLLTVPTHGWINLHFSLLPAWRGAAPVQHAIMAGDEITGATTFQLQEGLDTGPTLGTLTEQIGKHDTSGGVLGRLAVAGAGLLIATLDALEAGTIAPIPQPMTGISYAPKVTSADAQIQWHRPAYAVDRQIRGCTPSPGAWTTLQNQRLKIGPVRVNTTAEESTLRPGQLRSNRKDVLVGTGHGLVALGTVQPPGKQPMDAADWARGARLGPDDVLGEDA